MTEILQRERRFWDALAQYLEVCYPDLNGPNNIGGIADSELLQQFLPWNPKDTRAKLAPAVIDRVMQLIEQTGLSVATLEDIYQKSAIPLHTSLRLPLSPTIAWKRIRKTLTGE